MTGVDIAAVRSFLVLLSPSTVAPAAEEEDAAGEEEEEEEEHHQQEAAPIRIQQKAKIEGNRW